MSSEAVLPTDPDVNPWSGVHSPRTASLLDMARLGASYSVSQRTQMRYRSRCDFFASFCAQHGFAALPTSTQAILAFCGFCMEEGRARQLSSYLSAIAHQHKSHGFWSPTLHPAVSQVRKGLTRWVAVHHPRIARWRLPLRVSHVRDCFAQVDQSDPWVRQALAVLSFGLRIGQRASTLGNIRREHIKFGKEHVSLYIPRSKTDQEARGRYVYVEYPRPDSPPFHPVTLLSQHLKFNHIKSGFVFRAFGRGRRNMSDRPLGGAGVNLVVKWCCYDVLHLDGLYSGHSIRIGAATAMSEAGVEDHVIRQTCGWKGPYAHVYLRFAKSVRGDLSRAMGFL